LPASVKNYLRLHRPNSMSLPNFERGVDPAVAVQVAQQLMAKDALAAHARDELGISEITTARPVQAALMSAATFSVGAAMPLLMVVISPVNFLVPYRVRCLAGLPSSSGRNRSKSRRCECPARNRPRDLLGCACDGSHRRHWQTLWDGSLIVEEPSRLQLLDGPQLMLWTAPATGI